jgi:hypothetical protein
MFLMFEKEKQKPFFMNFYETFLINLGKISTKESKKFIYNMIKKSKNMAGALQDSLHKDKDFKSSI